MQSRKKRNLGGNHIRCNYKEISQAAQRIDFAAINWNAKLKVIEKIEAGRHGRKSCIRVITKRFHKQPNEEIRDKNWNAKLEIVVKIEAGARAEIRSLLK
jgi:hypothetical protein